MRPTHPTLSIVFLFIVVFLFSVRVPFAWANGGDQRLVDGGKYYINLSRAPFTPRVGVKTSMLASCFDVQANKLVAEDLMVKVRISRFGGSGSTTRTFIFEKDGVLVKGGVLELPYTFTESGLHEIFFDFAFTSRPDKVYDAPDFLIDVQKPENMPPFDGFIVSFMIGAISLLALGFMLGLFFGRRA